MKKGPNWPVPTLVLLTLLAVFYLSARPVPETGYATLTISNISKPDEWQPGGGARRPAPVPLVPPVYTLVNGDFEDGSTGWTLRHGFVLDNDTAHSGHSSARCDATFYDPAIDPSRGDARASWTNQRMNVTTGMQVFVSGYIKTEPSNCTDGLRIGVDFKNSTWGILRAHNGPFVPWGSNWTYVSFNDTVRDGEVKITLWLQGKPYDCLGSGWFDTLSLEIVPN